MCLPLRRQAMLAGAPGVYAGSAGRRVGRRCWLAVRGRRCTHLVLQERYDLHDLLFDVVDACNVLESGLHLAAADELHARAPEQRVIRVGRAAERERPGDD
jgi:hypothetical protein